MNRNKAIVIITIIGIAVVIFNVAQMGSDCSELRVEKAVAKETADAFRIQYDIQMKSSSLTEDQKDIIHDKHVKLQREYLDLASQLLDCTTK